MELIEEIKFVNQLFNNDNNVLPLWAIIPNNPNTLIFTSNISGFSIAGSMVITPIPNLLKLLFITYDLILNTNHDNTIKELYNHKISKELEELSKTHEFSLKEVNQNLQTEKLCLNLIKFNHLYYNDIKNELKTKNFNIKCMLNNKKILSIIDVDEDDIIKHIDELDLSYIQKQTYNIILAFLNKSKDFIKFIKPGILSKYEWEYIKLKYFT